MERAIIFVDGSNWYHGCAAIGLSRLGRLDFAQISRKLTQNRQWLSTRYYVGQMPQGATRTLAAGQRRFLRFLRSSDARISVHLGRIEVRQVRSEAAAQLLGYLGALRSRIDPAVYQDLLAVARDHAVVQVLVEKAVDVQLAVDMVVMAERDEYDTAYLLSADGDLTPAVAAVTATGRRVFVASPAAGARLAEVATGYLRLRRPWFADAYAP